MRVQAITPYMGMRWTSGRVRPVRAIDYPRSGVGEQMTTRAVALAEQKKAQHAARSSHAETEAAAPVQTETAREAGRALDQVDPEPKPFVDPGALSREMSANSPVQRWNVTGMDRLLEQIEAQSADESLTARIRDAMGELPVEKIGADLVGAGFLLH